MFVKRTLYEEAIDTMYTYMRLSQNRTLSEDEMIDYAIIAVNRVIGILDFDEKSLLCEDIQCDAILEGDEIFLDI